MWEKVEKKQGPIYRQIMEQIMREIENGIRTKTRATFWCESFHRCPCIGRA